MLKKGGLFVKKRTKLKDRKLPDYTRGEEIFNMVSHIVGGAFAICALVLCVVFAAVHRNVYGIITGAIYGISMIMVYTVSSVYHGLDNKRANTGKKVMQIIDHCDIYGLIVGTFAPVALTGLRESYPFVAWLSFGVVCAVCITGIVFTSIDYTKYRVISYGAYFVSGWSVVMTIKYLLLSYSAEFIVLLIAGGAVYTLGMIFFVLQLKNVKYSHSIFHLFIVAGSVIQFIAIFKYCI